MAENKQRQKLIHLHTPDVKVPSQGLLDLGEIAVQHNNEKAALYIEKTNGEIAKFIDETAVDAKIAVEKTRAEGAEAALDNKISTLNGSSHTHANKTVLDGISSEKVATWDAAEANAKKYADGLAKNYDAAGAAATAKSEVIGNDSDDKDSETIKGAKKYADSLNTAMNTRVVVLETSSHTHTNKTVLDGITAEKVAAWDAAEANASAYTDSAITALKLAETYAKKDVVETLVGDDADKSARNIAAEEVAKVVANAPENFDTLKEIADWISTDTTGSAQMANDISALKAISADTRLGTLEGKSHSHSNKDVLDGITSVKVSAWDAAEANAKKYADGLAKNYDAAGAAADAFASAKTYTDGLDAAMGSRVDALTSAVTDNEKVVAAALNQIIESVGLDGSGNSPLPGNISLVDAVSTLSGSNHTHANKTVLDGITSDKVTAWDAAKADAISSAKTYIDSFADGVKTYIDSVADGKANAVHNHAIDDVTGLQAALDGKDSEGAAAQALTDAKAYTDAQIKIIKIDCGTF